ncbi:MAG: hypothetical protein ACRDFS_07035 [Chloroflexota bacterium]
MSTVAAASDAARPSAATDGEFVLLCALDPFRDALNALDLALTTAEHVPGTDAKRGARSAMALVRGAADLLAARAATLEQAIKAYIDACTAV